MAIDSHGSFTLRIAAAARCKRVSMPRSQNPSQVVFSPERVISTQPCKPFLPEGNSFPPLLVLLAETGKVIFTQGGNAAEGIKMIQLPSFTMLLQALHCHLSASRGMVIWQRAW